MISEGIAIIIIVAIVAFALLEVFVLSIASRKKQQGYVEEIRIKEDNSLQTKKISVTILRVAAILNIISAALILFYGLFWLSVWGSEEIVISIICFALTGLLLTVGVYAILRRKWAVAFIGSIVAFIFFPITGLPAFLFAITSKKDWSKVKRAIIIGITIIIGIPWAWLMTIMLALAFNY